MKYPRYIKRGDFIGTTAPSAGIVEDSKILRLNNAKNNIEYLGYKYLETENVRKDYRGRSSTAEERAKEFMELWNNNDVSAIISASGGDFLLEMLDYLDFEQLKKGDPKWFQGYSDNTGLGFTFTTLLDIATIYCDNIGSYGMKLLYKNLTDSIKIMEGQELIQDSFGKYEINDRKKPLDSYNLTENVIWKSLDNKSNIDFSGRCLGGCFDVIINIIGTKYDSIKEYINKYKKDGIIWFLEVFEMSSPQVFLHLWQMKQARYFENCKGIIFGRSLMIREDYSMTFAEAVKDALGDLNIPIIYDTDIGHVSPQMAIVNGAILDVSYENGKGKIGTKLI